MQGAICWGRTLVKLFSTTSAMSGSLGLTDFPDKEAPFYTKDNVCTMSFGMVR